MVNRIEEFADVQIDYPVLLPARFTAFRDRVQRARFGRYPLPPMVCVLLAAFLDKRFPLRRILDQVVDFLEDVVLEVVGAVAAIGATLVIISARVGGPCLLGLLVVSTVGRACSCGIVSPHIRSRHVFGWWLKRVAGHLDQTVGDTTQPREHAGQGSLRTVGVPMATAIDEPGYLPLQAESML